MYELWLGAKLSEQCCYVACEANRRAYSYTYSSGYGFRTDKDAVILR